MTKLQIDKKDLIEQPGWMVLQQAVELCESKNVEKVRRSVLKRSCDEQLNEITNGDRTTFGGSFEHYIKKYSDPELLPNERLLTCEKEGNRTFIIPNILGIKSFVGSKILQRPAIDPFSDMVKNEIDQAHIEGLYKNVYQLQIDAAKKIKEKIQKNKNNNIEVTSTFGASGLFANSEKLFMEDCSLQIFAAMTADRCKLFLFHPSDKTVHLMDKLLILLIDTIKNISGTNDLIPFKLIVEYKGIPKNIDGSIKSEVNTRSLQRVCKKFTETKIQRSYINHFGRRSVIIGLPYSIRDTMILRDH
jgi:hypothetical protein